MHTYMHVLVVQYGSTWHFLSASAVNSLISHANLVQNTHTVSRVYLQHMLLAMHSNLWFLQVGEGKSEVDEVVEHFNICAGNPAVCMTQVRWLLGGPTTILLHCLLSRAFLVIQQ